MFKIIQAPASKSGSVPGHYDITLGDNEDSLITVWDSFEMAQEIVTFLEHRTEFKKWLARPAETAPIGSCL